MVWCFIQCNKKKSDKKIQVMRSEAPIWIKSFVNQSTVNGHEGV